MASKLSVPVRSSDDVKHLEWSEASAVVSTWFDAPGGWVVEGVAAVRALRKWLDRNPTGAPCDHVIFLEEPFVALTKEQTAMGRGCVTVWQKTVDRLRARGVTVSVCKAPPITKAVA